MSEHGSWSTMKSLSGTESISIELDVQRISLDDPRSRITKRTYHQVTYYTTIRTLLDLR